AEQPLYLVQGMLAEEGVSELKRNNEMSWDTRDVIGVNYDKMQG
ncbi:668_t:CDS:1, partial [Dentiscutata heterogama]